MGGVHLGGRSGGEGTGWVAAGALGGLGVPQGMCRGYPRNGCAGTVWEGRQREGAWSAGETGDTQGCHTALGALWKPWGAVSREEGDLGGQRAGRGGAEMPSEPCARGISDEGGTVLGTGARPWGWGHAGLQPDWAVLP